MDIRHDDDRHRFVLETRGAEAFLAYTMPDDGTIHFSSTFVPPAIRNRGLGGRLVSAGLEHAMNEGYRVTSSCWFVDEFLARNPKYAELVEG